MSRVMVIRAGGTEKDSWPNAVAVWTPPDALGGFGGKEIRREGTTHTQSKKKRKRFGWAIRGYGHYGMGGVISNLPVWGGASPKSWRHVAGQVHTGVPGGSGQHEDSVGPPAFVDPVQEDREPCQPGVEPAERLELPDDQ